MREETFTCGYQNSVGHFNFFKRDNCSCTLDKNDWDALKGTYI